jgi:hypothetical protein
VANASFDIVSKVDRQEIDNALNQAVKELSQRFDFKNTGASVKWQGEMGVEIRANSEERAKAALDVFKDKLVKRKVSLKPRPPPPRLAPPRGPRVAQLAWRAARRGQAPALCFRCCLTCPVCKKVVCTRHDRAQNRTGLPRLYTLLICEATLVECRA